MAAANFFAYFVLASLLIQHIASVDQPSPSTAPEPAVAADSPYTSPPAASLSPDSGSPSLTPELSPASSPPAPPPSDLADAPASSSVPSPAPSQVSDLKESNVVVDGDGEPSGLSGGKKAGVVVGVVVAACFVGLGAVIFKRRRDNIRRSEYGYAARRELL